MKGTDGMGIEESRVEWMDTVNGGKAWREEKMQKCHAGALEERVR